MYARERASALARRRVHRCGRRRPSGSTHDRRAVRRIRHTPRAGEHVPTAGRPGPPGKLIVLTDGTTGTKRVDRHAASLWCSSRRCCRILTLGPETIATYDKSSVSVICCADSALPVGVTDRAIETFGPVVYNLYGSSAAGVAAVATPADTRAVPGCVGKPLAKAIVRLCDEDDRLVGLPGRISTILCGLQRRRPREDHRRRLPTGLPRDRFDTCFPAG